MKEIYDYDFSLIGSTIKKIQNILILALVYKFIFVILLRFYLRSNTMKLILCSSLQNYVQKRFFVQT